MRPKPDTVGRYLWHVSGLPYSGQRIATTLRHARGKVDESFIPAREHGHVTREARRLLGAYLLLVAGSLALGSAALLWLWVLPALLGQPFLRAYLLAEHTGCPLIPDMLRNSPPPGACRWCAGSPGTCPTMPSTTPIRPCRSMLCRRRTSS
jgi:hypothetical protein